MVQIYLEINGLIHTKFWMSHDKNLDRWNWPNFRAEGIYRWIMNVLRLYSENKILFDLERSKVFHRKNHLRLQLQWIKWNLKMTTKFQITRNNSNHNEIYYEIKLNALWFNNSDYNGNDYLMIVRWRKAVIWKNQGL